MWDLRKRVKARVFWGKTSFWRHKWAYVALLWIWNEFGKNGTCQAGLHTAAYAVEIQTFVCSLFVTAAQTKADAYINTLRWDWHGLNVCSCITFSGYPVAAELPMCSGSLTDNGEMGVFKPGGTVTFRRHLLDTRVGAFAFAYQALWVQEATFKLWTMFYAWSCWDPHHMVLKIEWPACRPK